MAHHTQAEFQMQLFVTPGDGASERAIGAMRTLLAKHPEASCRVRDVIECSELASAERVVIVPTLIRDLPTPRRRIVGAIGDASLLEREILTTVPEA